MKLEIIAVMLIIIMYVIGFVGILKLIGRAITYLEIKTIYYQRLLEQNDLNNRQN